MGAESKSVPGFRVPYSIFKRRLRRRLGYGFRANVSRLSLPLADFPVSYFKKNAPFDDLDAEFAMNLSREAAVHPCTLVVSILYLERLRMKNLENFVTSDPASLYLTSLLLANKYLFDEGTDDFIYNDEWAASSGVPLEEVNSDEIRFLTHLVIALGEDWNLGCSPSDFAKVLQEIETKFATDQLLSSRQSGASTYVQLDVLSSAILRNDPSLLWTLASDILKHLGLLTMAYVSTIVLAFSAVVFGPSILHACTPSASPGLRFNTLINDFEMSLTDHSSLSRSSAATDDPAQFLSHSMPSVLEDKVCLDPKSSDLGLLLFAQSSNDSQSAANRNSGSEHQETEYHDNRLTSSSIVDNQRWPELDGSGLVKMCLNSRWTFLEAGLYLV